MKKVLILEDEEKLGAIYKRALEKEGYQVLWITTAEEALAQVQDFGADLLLVDHGLRGDGMSGLEALPKFKKLMPKAKIVIFSNYSDFYLQEQAQKAGADEYWMKIDMTLRDLLGRIEELLRK